MREIPILLIGDTSRAEFREARLSLEGFGQLVQVNDIEGAVAELAAGRIAPDLIVLAQARPGQFPAKAVDRLRHLAPLARILVLLGSWCEGEMRTGDPSPGVIRIYWHEWLPRCARELAQLSDGLVSGWGLPVTANDEERLLAADDEEQPRSGLIAIRARQHAVHDWLSAACRRRGYSTAWLSPEGPDDPNDAVAAIFDGTDCDDSEAAQLEHLATSLGPTPVVALLDFPRIEDHHRAIAAGAAAVLSKPLLLDDLFWQLDQLAE